MSIRFANAEDAETLLKIYEQYIDTPITFEYNLPSLNEFENRIIDISKIYPYLVYEADSRIVGYAYAHRDRVRKAYDWNVETSIYVDSNYVGGGVGKALYTRLIDLLKKQGIRNLYAYITLPNEKSEGMHKKLGFDKIGTYHKTGYKNGNWYDVGIFEKCIGELGVPSDIIPISEICII